MAKSNRQIYKVPQPKQPKAVQLESNAAAKAAAPVLPEKNNLCFGLFWASLALGFVLDGLLIYFLAHNTIASFTQQPTPWVQAILNTVCLVMSISLLRGVIWGSFVLAATVANRTQSFTAQVQICQWARKYQRLLPGGAAWATQAIIQRLLTREEYKETIALGTADYDAALKKNSKDYQSQANLASCSGFAYQMLNEQHKAIEWNEKAVSAYEKLFIEIDQSKGVSKLAAKNVLDSLQLQYAQVLAASATAYLYTRNRVKAKEHLKNALAQARKAQDSPQKRDIIRVCEEHLSQLKHF